MTLPLICPRPGVIPYQEQGPLGHICLFTHLQGVKNISDVIVATPTEFLSEMQLPKEPLISALHKKLGDFFTQLGIPGYSPHGDANTRNMAEYGLDILVFRILNSAPLATVEAALPDLAAELTSASLHRTMNQGIKYQAVAQTDSKYFLHSARPGKSDNFIPYYSKSNHEHYNYAAASVSVMYNAFGKLLPGIKVYGLDTQETRTQAQYETSIVSAAQFINKFHILCDHRLYAVLDLLTGAGWYTTFENTNFQIQIRGVHLNSSNFNNPRWVITCAFKEFEGGPSEYPAIISPDDYLVACRQVADHLQSNLQYLSDYYDTKLPQQTVIIATEVSRRLAYQMFSPMGYD